MPSSTAHWQLPYPLQTEPANIGGTDFQLLAQALDSGAANGPYVAMFSMGANASLPSTVSAAGSIYLATDAAVMYISNGTAWQAVPIGGASPIGTMHPYSGTGPVTMPDKTYWVPCDGAAYSRTTYAAAFAVMGTTYGVGDGSTTFNVPDSRGRALIGAGPGTGLTNRAAGATGGEEAHTLTLAEGANHSHGVNDPGHGHSINDPQHGHSVSDPGHSHNVTDPQHNHDGLTNNHNNVYQLPLGGAYAVGGNANYYVPNPPYTATPGIGGQGINLGINFGLTGISIASGATSIVIVSRGTGVTVNSGTTGITTATAGGGTGHNNMQPFLAVNYLIRLS